MEISVTDSGAGMPAEVVAKAFDPFFTTKPAGRGTGLGLSQVYGFVRQSGGQIRIESEVGVGTTIRIHLPRFVGSQTLAPEPLQKKGIPAKLPAGRPAEIILVVEDELRVRQLSVEALRDLGYTVIHAGSALDGLREIDAHPNVTLLFTDVVMPDVNGRRLADEALRRSPDLKVLFTTGYTRDAVVRNGVLEPGVNLITKPFTVAELATRVREVIDGPTIDRGPPRCLNDAYAALRLTELSAIAVSLASVAFSSSRFCCNTLAQSSRPRRLAQATSVP